MRNMNCTGIFKSTLFIVDKTDKIQTLGESGLGEQIMCTQWNNAYQWN